MAYRPLTHIKKKIEKRAPKKTLGIYIDKIWEILHYNIL